MYYQLHLRRCAGGGAPLRTHTVHGRLPRGGHCRQLSHLISRVGLYFRDDHPLSRSASRWLADRGGKWLSVIGGLMLRTAGRWWAGLWVHSTKAAKSSRGPSSDDRALHAVKKKTSKVTFYDYLQKKFRLKCR